jgi:hypothetical protein
MEASRFTPSLIDQPLNEPGFSMQIEEITVDIRQLLRQENVNHYHIGLLYNHAVEHKLAQARGYKDALSYFADHLQEISRATLVMYGTVAEEFEEEVCMRYGVTCLSLLLTYEEAAATQADRKEPGTTLISVPDEKGHVTRKPFATCSVADMRKALQRLRKPASSAPVPAEEEARLQFYRDAVARKFPKKSRIQVSARNHKGTVLVSLKDIPLGDMEKLIEALMDSLPTGSATARD